MDRYAEATPDRPALVEDGATWRYRELHHAVRQIAAALQSLGIRPGDRMMIVSENCIALAGLLLAASRIDAWAVAGLKRFDRGSLRLIAVAGAPLDLDLKSRVEQEFDLPLSNGYGITECSPGISGVRFDAPRADQAVGTLLPGIEARIRTIDGIPLARGEIGELHVRGRNVMRGYYRAPDLTAHVIDTHGVFNTGDLARFDGDCLYIVCRAKGMIIRSGFNVCPGEREELALS